MEDRLRALAAGQTSGQKKRIIQAAKYKPNYGTKAEGQGFADKRKKQIHYDYQKMLKKEKLSQSLKREYEPKYSDEEEEEEKPRKKKKKKAGQTGTGDEDSAQQGMNIAEPVNRFTTARAEFLKKEEEKMKRQKEYLQKKEEKEKALAEYQIKKKARFKKLCKKNYKGQPIMKNQIEFLLEKIERQVNQT